MPDLIDTHAHIYLPEFSDDLDGVMERAVEAGVTGIFMPNIDLESMEPMRHVHSRYSGLCYPMIGLHPCSVKPGFQQVLDQMEDRLKKENFYGIGETGTDLYWDKTYFAEQKVSLIRQVGMAREHNLPVILHTRNSMEETISIIREQGRGEIKGIFHCFSGTLEQARQIIELGFMLGIGGVVTFKNSGLDKILPELDPAHLVLETDSPWLAPVPYRGKRNEPSRIFLIVQKLSEIIRVPVKEVAEITTNNALKLFNLNP